MENHKIYFSSVGNDFVNTFPAIVELYFEKRRPKTKKRDFDILDKRFALSGSHHYTLENLGTYYDLTRERVRQIETKSIKNLDLLLRGALKNKSWSIASAVCAEYIEIVHILKSYSLLILLEQVDSLFLSRNGAKLPSGYLDLFMEIAGFSKIPQSIEGFRGSLRCSWCKTDQYKSKEFASVFRALDVIFDNPAEPISLFDLTIKAKRSTNISNEYIQIAISACNDIEIFDNQARVRLSSLNSAADKAFRILHASKKPMHYSDIVREINLLQKDLPIFRPLKNTTLKNQLVSDKRFIAIGRSGEWGLAQWEGLNTGTITDTISNILHKNGAPMKLSDIVEHVTIMRPDVSSKSVSAYLNTSDLFSRVGKAEYALSSWRLPKAGNSERVKHVDINALVSAVKACFDKNTSISFPALIRFVSDEIGLSDVSTRHRLLTLPFLDIRYVDGKKSKTAYLVGPINNDINQTEKILLRDLVQREIRSILNDKPNEEMKKGALYKKVSKTVKCKRPTFYQYLREMKDIRQYKNGNMFFVVFEHKEFVPNIEINLANYNIDSTLRAELNRPLSKLTMEEVDIALFELGIIFENKLREFLQMANNKGVLKISAKDMGRLFDMVNCAVREGVVTSGHHLDTLREERNKRAHGNIPTLQERQILFNKAHYVADLFVKYIALFYEKKKALR